MERRISVNKFHLFLVVVVLAIIAFRSCRIRRQPSGEVRAWSVVAGTPGRSGAAAANSAARRDDDLRRRPRGESAARP